MTTKKKMLGAAAGTAAAGGGALDIDEVFSTFLYSGTGSAQTITNGIDLAGEGGLTWIKSRTSANTAYIYDTERGATTSVTPSDNYAQESSGTTLTAFNSNGFSLGSANKVNGSSNNYASWTFRKAPKFFTCLTYTGNGVAGRTISHDLGTTVGMLVVKRTDSSASWAVYHKGLNGGTNPEQYYTLLDSTAAEGQATTLWNDTAPTSSAFTVGTNAAVNNHNNATYVAYLFAHNDGDGGFGPDGDQDIIKCGSYTGVYAGAEVNLGFEPQWILFKSASSTGDWSIFDAMRGIVTGGLSGDGDAALFPNTSGAENVNTWGVDLTATGFITYGNNVAATNDMIYMAIRRGPLAPPESATEVFASYIAGQGASDPALVSGFVTDFATRMYRSGGIEQLLASRLQGGKYLETSNTAVEQSAGLDWDYQTGWYDALGNSLFMSHMWKRAPSFCDVVCYSGNSTAGRAVSHNVLGVAPEMIWVKNRGNANDWVVWHSALSATQSLKLNLTNAVENNSWFTSVPTDQYFYPNSYQGINASGHNYIAYLFASLAGVSKVGSYTGTGAAQNIDCGFTTGARFILLKKTSGTGNWYLFDSTRGIVAGNDPYLYLNSTAAQYSGRDGVDPLSSGFALTTDTTFNASGATYIFYAIA